MTGAPGGCRKDLRRTDGLAAPAMLGINQERLSAQSSRAGLPGWGVMSGAQWGVFCPGSLIVIPRAPSGQPARWCASGGWTPPADCRAADRVKGFVGSCASSVQPTKDLAAGSGAGVRGLPFSCNAPPLTSWMRVHAVASRLPSRGWLVVALRFPAITPNPGTRAWAARQRIMFRQSPVNP